MNILVLNGSPKSKSDTMVLTNASIPLIQKKMETTADGIRHLSKVDFSKMHTLIICGGGFPNYEHNFEGIHRQCELSFGNLTQLYVPKSPLLNEPLAALLAKIKSEDFEKAGEEYEKTFTLSDQTIEKLQSLMIPKQEYINALNSAN